MVVICERHFPNDHGLCDEMRASHGLPRGDLCFVFFGVIFHSEKHSWLKWVKFMVVQRNETDMEQRARGGPEAATAINNSTDWGVVALVNQGKDSQTGKTVTFEGLATSCCNTVAHFLHMSSRWLKVATLQKGRAVGAST